MMDNRYTSNGMNMGEAMHLPQQPVESNEFVELIYGRNNSTASTGNYNISSTSTPVVSTITQVSEDVQRVSQPTSNSTYKCEVCARQFSKASCFSKHKRGALCRHLSMKHKKNKKKNLRPNKTSEKKPKSFSEDIKPYECNLCGAKFLDKGNGELHLERAHNTRQSLWLQNSKSEVVACPDCNVWFNNKKQLRDHQQNEHTNVAHFAQHNNETQIFQTLPQQNLPPPHQYYFQPLHPIHPYNSNQIPQYGPPHPTHPPPHQQAQMLPQMTQTAHLQGHQMSSVMIPQPQHNQIYGSMAHTSHHSHPNNNCINGAINQISDITLPISTASSLSETPKNIKQSRAPPASSTTPTKNLCGECGLKFVDPINMELHMQRKHPNSTLVETVDLKNGIMLYKTSNSDNLETFSKRPKFINVKKNNKASKMPNPMAFGCALCRFEVLSMDNIIEHLQNSHSTSNASFINVISMKKSKVKNKRFASSKNASDSGNKYRYICDSCFSEFKTKSELISHTTSKKNILCGICEFISCSRAKVSAHMNSMHKENKEQVPVLSFEKKTNCTSSNKSSTMKCTQSEIMLSSDSESLNVTICSPSPDQHASSKGDGANQNILKCCICNFNALSGMSLAQHLDSHGSIEVKCGKCDRSSESFMDISKHISVAHSGSFTRVFITMKSLPSSPVYMFMISPETADMNESCSKDKSDLQSNDLIQVTAETELNGEVYNFTNETLYICSICNECLKESCQFDAHLRVHQPSHTKSNEEMSCNQTPLSASSCLSSLDLVDSCNSEFNASPISRAKCSIEFKCKECGFWSKKSEPVIHHIKTEHLTGCLLHNIRINCSKTKSLSIIIFTPLNQEYS